MATGITIQSVDYANAPAALQNWKFEYKLSTDLNWILASASSSVNTDGTLSVPIPISGLVSGQLYLIRGAALCNSPLEYFIQMAQL